MKPALTMSETCAALGVSVRSFYDAAAAGEEYATYLLKHSMGGGRGRPRSWDEKYVIEARRMREAVAVRGCL